VANNTHSELLSIRPSVLIRGSRDNGRNLLALLLCANRLVALLSRSLRGLGGAGRRCPSRHGHGLGPSRGRHSVPVALPVAHRSLLIDGRRHSSMIRRTKARIGRGRYRAVVLARGKRPGGLGGRLVTLLGIGHHWSRVVAVGRGGM
jgi:hypothetical protein